MRFSLMLALLTVPGLARAETFDIISYTPPKGWSMTPLKEGRAYTSIDRAAGTSCRINIFSSVPTTGSARGDFDADWALLAGAFYPGISNPELGRSTQVGGWTLLGGGSQHTIEGKDTLVMQFTLSGARRLSLLAVSTRDCQAELGDLIGSISFPAVSGSAPKAAATGWVSTAREDWVEVTNGLITVYLHHPNAKADAYNSVLRDGLQNAWNVLVAPHSSQVRNFALKPIQSYESISFAEADAVDRANRPVHVVLFKKHDSQARNRYLEFIAPDKATFERQFGAYHADEFGWDALVNMGNFNAFPVTMADLTGTWASTDFASISYAYVSTGRPAGASATALADTFTFDGKGGYSSDSTGASGAVGNAKFSRQVYRGTASISSAGLTLTNRFEGQPETYTAYFQAVKQGRVLVLTDRLKTTRYLVKQR